ncbi:MAG: hypothetical protein ACOC4I_06120, partial [Spirochaetota bacterium]
IGISYLQVPAFSDIQRGVLERALDLVRSADLTILCAFPFGHGNAANLDIAEQARELMILDDSTALCRRAFFGDAAELEVRFRRLEAIWGTVNHERACACIASIIDGGAESKERDGTR